MHGLNVPAWLLVAGMVITMIGCRARPPISPSDRELLAPALTSSVTVDGNLDETCYSRAPLVENFVIAGDAKRRAAKTRAWLLWNSNKLVFAFDCDDAAVVAAARTASERDVDPQDRVEVFLWSGHNEDPYYCLELAAQGAVHDYSARFYRKFDDAWTPHGWESAVKSRPGGYRVEAAVSRAALKEMGFALRVGERWRVGLFRADFSPGRANAPDWITWVDARTPQPDFHVAGAFGIIELSKP